MVDRDEDGMMDPVPDNWRDYTGGGCGCLLLLLAVAVVVVWLVS
jgi:hypothetical protein